MPAMGWIRATWTEASRAQKAIVGIGLVVGVAAVASIGRLALVPPDGASPSPSGSASPVADTAAPILAELRPVSADNPGTLGLTYTFSSDEPGTILYGGPCTSPRTEAKRGNNTLTFDFLRPGNYKTCTIQVTDRSGNSSTLAVRDFTVNPRPMSIARIWNEAVLSAIRVDRARPPVQARNLFHTSAAMYDIWAAYDGKADTFLLGHPGCPLTSPLPPNRVASEKEAISYEMYRLIVERFSGSPGVEATKSNINQLMAKLGYDPKDGSTDISTGSAAALGNYVALCYINYGLRDGSNEAGLHANTYYQPVNGPLIPTQPGTQAVANLDRWQPLTLNVFIDQSGNVVVGGAPPFIGAEWGNVTPFAMTSADLTTYHRDSNRDGVPDTFKITIPADRPAIWGPPHRSSGGISHSSRSGPRSWILPMG